MATGPIGIALNYFLRYHDFSLKFLEKNMWLAGREDEYALSIIPGSGFIAGSELPSEDFCINQMRNLLLINCGAWPWNCIPAEQNENTNLTIAEWRRLNYIKKSELACVNYAGVWQPVIGKFHRESCAPYLEVSTATANTPDKIVSLIRRGQLAAGHLARLISTDEYSVRCFNAVSDRKGGQAKSSGMHENYLISRNFYDRLVPTNAVGELETKFLQHDCTLLQDLASFEVLLTIFLGEGKIGGDLYTQDVPYQISARADFVRRTVGFNTSGMDRPLINMRDEPHADRDRFARLHVINREGNRSAWGPKLGIGLHMIFLNAMQNGFRLSWRFQNPIAALHVLSQDPALKKEVPIIWRKNNNLESKKITFLLADILRGLSRYISWAHVPSWCYEIVDKAEFLLRHLERGDPEGEATKYLDWKIKERFLKEYISRNLKLSADNISSWYSPKCRQMDIKYHQLDDERVWEHIAEFCNVADFDRFHKPFGDPKEDRFWKESPPEDGRSYLMWLVSTNPHLKEKITIGDWEFLEFRLPHRLTLEKVFMGDPRLFGKAHLNKLFESGFNLETEGGFEQFIARLKETPGAEIHNLYNPVYTGSSESALGGI